MAFTIEFLYENGEPVRALDNEVLDEEKIQSILKLKVNDIIPLGSGSEKQNYIVLKINRSFVSARLSGQGEDNTHFDFIVKAISAFNRHDYMLGCHLKPEPKHHEFELIRPITSSDMDIINISMKKLGDFGSCCTLYEICDKNYQSILSYHGTVKDDFPLNRHRAYEYMEDASQEMNRLLLNYLSSFKTFIDHLTTRYTRLQRQGHSFLDDFKKLTAACYDGNFPYRFFSKLRDYVQHCGLPLGSMSIEEYPDQKGNVVINVLISMDRDKLISSYKKWGKVMPDLHSQPQNMELLPYLNGFQSQIQLINLVVSVFEISLATDSWHTIDELVHEAQEKYPNGRPFIGRYEEPEGQQKLNVIEFPFHTMAKFQEKLRDVKAFQTRKKRKGKTAT